MEIAGIPNLPISNKQNEDPLSLKKAIKAYQDEAITGLTDEEKAEIEKQAKEYLNSHPLKTEQDRSAFNEFVKSLIKKFGFKGDIDEMVGGLVNMAIDSAKDSDQQISVENHFQKEAMGVMSAKNKINYDNIKDEASNSNLPDSDEEFRIFQNDLISRARMLPPEIMNGNALLKFQETQTAKIVFEFGEGGSIRIKEGLSPADYARARETLRNYELWLS